MKKKLFLLVAVIAALVQNVFAYDFSAVAPSGQTLYYKITDSVNHYVELTFPNEQIEAHSIGDPSWVSGYMLWGSNQPMGALVLPDTVSCNGITYTIRAIGPYAFYDRPYITSVVMPNTVEIIELCAFAGCINLASITFSNSLRIIGWASFEHCYLVNVVLPSSVREIQQWAFSDCHLINITLNDSLENLGWGCLQNNALESLFIPASVNYIENNPFYCCNDIL